VEPVVDPLVLGLGQHPVDGVEVLLAAGVVVTQPPAHRPLVGAVVPPAGREDQGGSRPQAPGPSLPRWRRPRTRTRTRRRTGRRQRSPPSAEGGSPSWP
jgi:hypothetical protein